MASDMDCMQSCASCMGWYFPPQLFSCIFSFMFMPFSVVSAISCYSGHIVYCTCCVLFSVFVPKELYMLFASVG